MFTLQLSPKQLSKLIRGQLASQTLTAISFTFETGKTTACAGHNGCPVWQQFVYATDYIGAATAAVFMQYWLLNAQLGLLRLSERLAQI